VYTVRSPAPAADASSGWAWGCFTRSERRVKGGCHTGSLLQVRPARLSPAGCESCRGLPLINRKPEASGVGWRWADHDADWWEGPSPSRSSGSPQSADEKGPHLKKLRTRHLVWCLDYRVDNNLGYGVHYVYSRGSYSGYIGNWGPEIRSLSKEYKAHNVRNRQVKTMIKKWIKEWVVVPTGRA
jgi:hypothetical protein